MEISVHSCLPCDESLCPQAIMEQLRLPSQYVKTVMKAFKNVEKKMDRLYLQINGCLPTGLQNHVEWGRQVPAKKRKLIYS